MEKNELYLSFGNKDKKATVIKTTLTEKEIFNKYKKYDYVKIDKIDKSIKVSIIEFVNIFRDLHPSLGLDDNKIVVLSEQLRTYNIVDVKNRKINYDNLNNYLFDNGFEPIRELTMVNAISMESKFLVGKDFVPLVEKNGFNMRDVNYVKENMDDLLKKSATRLSIMANNGRFNYGYHVNTGIDLNDYNVVRHAGSTWAMVTAYREYPSPKLKKSIEDAIDYMFHVYRKDYGNLMFITDYNVPVIFLGTQGLALAAVSEYMEIFKTDKYAKEAELLAKSILYCQNYDGSLNHVLNYSDCTLRKKDACVFYDGEAILGLLLYYRLTKNAYYLERSKVSIDYFIDNHYEKYRDHWVAYCFREFLKYNQDEKYISFHFLNYTHNFKDLDNFRVFGPVRIELLMSIYESYLFLKKKKVKSKALDEFKVEALQKSIETTVDVLFGYYLNDEVAMYMEKPSLIEYGFCCFDDDFRLRIDDIQHTLSGMIKYNNIILKGKDC